MAWSHGNCTDMYTKEYRYVTQNAYEHWICRHRRLTLTRWSCSCTLSCADVRLCCRLALSWTNACKQHQHDTRACTKYLLHMCTCTRLSNRNSPTCTTSRTVYMTVDHIHTPTYRYDSYQHFHLRLVSTLLPTIRINTSTYDSYPHRTWYFLYTRKMTSNNTNENNTMVTRNNYTKYSERRFCYEAITMLARNNPD